jgi:hypothetical protein
LKPRLFSSAERGWSVTLVLAYVAWRLGTFAFRAATSGPHDIVGEGVMLGFVVLVGAVVFFVIRRSRQQDLERQRQLDAWRRAEDRLAK